MFVSKWATKYGEKGSKWASWKSVSWKDFLIAFSCLFSVKVFVVKSGSSRRLFSTFADLFNIFKGFFQKIFNFKKRCSFADLFIILCRLVHYFLQTCSKFLKRKFSERKNQVTKLCKNSTIFGLYFITSLPKSKILDFSEVVSDVCESVDIFFHIKGGFLQQKNCLMYTKNSKIHFAEDHRWFG